MPREWVVISGKGGTGKTSILAALGLLAHRPVLADCDVDASNLHLILEPRIEERGEFRAGHQASIRTEDCTRCGLCLDLCRFDAVKVLHAGNYRIDPLACEGCGVCAHFCPAQAVDFTEQTAGEWFVSVTRAGPMVHAELGVAQENSGKLVSLVRQKARELAEREDRDLVLIDGPPGIGCPVIASMTGADVVLAVTEPTASGLHDLERVVQLARHFAIPIGVCLNKSDLAPEASAGIEAFCEREQVPIWGRIAYDPAFTHAQMDGQTIIEAAPESSAARQIRNLWSGMTDAPEHDVEAEQVEPGPTRAEP